MRLTTAFVATIAALSFFQLFASHVMSHEVDVPAQRSAAGGAERGKVYKILPLGDSITQGGASYRYPLWEKLHAAGYFVEYVGSRESQTRIGAIRHEGWSGHQAQFFAREIEKFYAPEKADIVLLHAGHNYEAKDDPIPTILASTETIVTTVHRLNPDAIVFVSQVITAGKLPKYSYIPELNIELAKLVERLDPKQEKVRLVNHAEGWNYEVDCTPDKVHPTHGGAEKMADKWFEALVKALPSPGEQRMPELATYKKGKGYDLKLHVFKPTSAVDVAKPRGAVVYFFGGGWSHGTPLQFYAECRQLAARGMVAISADYRISSQNKVTPFDSLADATSAIRWVRQHASELGIDPNRIAAAGSSAGGHLAAACAITSGFDDPSEDQSISYRPNALVLTAPVINNGPDGFGYEAVKDRYKEFSPYHALRERAPPTLVFLGSKDGNTSVEAIEDFQSRLRQFGGQCDVHIFDGFGHGLFAYREPPTPVCNQIRDETAAFLKALGYFE